MPGRRDAEAAPVAGIRKPVLAHVLDDRRSRALTEKLEEMLQVGSRAFGDAMKAAVLVVGHETGQAQVSGSGDHEIPETDAVERGPSARPPRAGTGGWALAR